MYDDTLGYRIVCVHPLVPFFIYLFIYFINLVLKPSKSAAFIILFFFDTFYNFGHKQKII